MHAVTHNQRAVIVFLFKCETISSYGRMDTDIKDNVSLTLFFKLPNRNKYLLYYRMDTLR